MLSKKKIQELKQVLEDCKSFVDKLINYRDEPEFWIKIGEFLNKQAREDTAYGYLKATLLSDILEELENTQEEKI